MRATLWVLTALLFTMDRTAMAEDMTVHVIESKTGRPVNGMRIRLRLAKLLGDPRLGPEISMTTARDGRALSASHRRFFPT
jgi:5-hydroxyisourate hydrolase-like protein (transthyretin family)